MSTRGEITARRVLMKTQGSTQSLGVPNNQSRASSRDSHYQNEAVTKERKSKSIDIAAQTETQESDQSKSSSRIVQLREGNAIEIDRRENIYSVAFLVDGKHVVSGGLESKIRRWQVEDGNEVGAPMDAGGDSVWSIAVSRDGSWIVAGTSNGRVLVWDAAQSQADSEMTEIRCHSGEVSVADVSPDGTRFVTGSHDKTACVWSLPTGRRLLDPWEHDYYLAAIRFSPDGRRVATATWCCDSVRIYDSHEGHVLVRFPVQVSWLYNGSLAWVSNSQQLFALSRYNGNINCLDISTEATLNSWPIHSTSGQKCIALASNGTFLAASAGSSVSFWDTTTHKQIGSAIEYTHEVFSMAISTKYDIVVAGDKKITLRSLRDILPSLYLGDVSVSA